MTGRRVRSVALAVASSLLVVLAPPALMPAQAATSTGSVDTLRTSWDPNEPTLSPASIASSDFGQIFDTTLDGQIYAQPLLDSAAVYVTTEKAKAFALDRLTGAVLWSRTDLGDPFQAATVGCADLVPDLGSTSTGVIDPVTRTWYFTTKFAIGANSAAWWLQGVSLDTGVTRAGFPVQIQGTPANDPSTAFFAFDQQQRPALLLLGGVVYVGFGAHCDVLPFKGYVVGVSTTTHAITTMWTSAVGARLSGGGVWQAGGGIVSDGPGRLFVSTGNGFFGGNQSGTPGLLAESVVRLKVGTTGALSTDDWFTPSNAKKLDANDQDLGSGAPTALPDGFGTALHPHLMIEEGKDGRLFVLDRDDLGHYAQGPNGGDRIMSTTDNVGGLWGHPAFFGAGGGYAYVAPVNQPLKALAFGVDGTLTPRFTVVGTSTGNFGYTSGSPVVTSNGTDPSSGLVWILYSSGSTGVGGELRAYDAIPVKGVITLRWHQAVGAVSKFSQVATDGGLVVVGTRDGHVKAFGRPQNAAVASSPVEFGSTPVSTSVPGTATLTATENLTITALSASAPFSVTPPSLPLSLAVGDKVDVPVSFSSAAPGDLVGQLVVTTSAGTFSTGLHGLATRPGLASAPALVAFGAQPTGLERTLSVVVQNTGASATTITGVTPPIAPFSLIGPPAIDTVIEAGASITVGIAFDPTSIGSASAEMVITSADGPVTVPLTGAGIQGASKLDLPTATIDVGVVPVGLTLERYFTVSNGGNLPLSITKAKAPTVPFSADNPLPEGLQISPGNIYSQQIRFTPTTAGYFTDSYEVTGDDGAGAQYVTLQGRATTTVDAVVPPPGAVGWRLNGSAVFSAGSVVLTPATAGQIGSVFYGRQVATDNLYVRFRTLISGPAQGAEGIALALLDPATENPSALGAGGAGLGVSGLHGVAVTADTNDSGVLEPAAPFTGIVNADTSQIQLPPNYVATAPMTAGLRNTSRVFTVTYVDGILAVYVDGVLASSHAVTLPSSVLVGFTAATGAVLSDKQWIRDVVISRVPLRDIVTGASTWSRNGGATATSTVTRLTTASANRAASTISSARLSTGELTASFTASLGGGTGADGMTFALLDPTATSATSVGGKAGALGFGGLSGTAVTLDTSRGTGEPSSNFVGIATSVKGGVMHYLATTTAVPNLRAGSHKVVVRTWQGHLIVSIDSKRVLDAVVPVPPTAFPAFTASTGVRTDAHWVSAVSIVAVRSVLAPSLTGSGWTRNGTAVVSGSSVQLTPNLTNRKGTTFVNAAMFSTGLHVRYTARIAPGTSGGDGMALALVPSSVVSTSLGAAGGGVGWAGLGGVAVVSDSYANSGDPGRDFIGIATGLRGGLDKLLYAATTPVGRGLTVGSHVIDVAYVDGRLYAWVDGLPRLSPAVTLPPTLRVGFTASTGGRTDLHAVSAVSIATT